MQFHNISTLQSHIVILTDLTIFLVYMLCMFVCMFVLLALTPSAYGLSLMLIKLCSVLFYSLRFVGSVSLERNVLDVKSHVLPFTPFSDTSLRHCYSMSKSVKVATTIIYLSKKPGFSNLRRLSLRQLCYIWCYNFLRSEGKSADR